MISFFPSRTVALDLFGFSVHWYGIMYFLAFLIAWLLVPRLQKKRTLSFSNDEWSSLLSAAVLGVIVGGRLGFVLFYEPAYFLAHPLKVFAVWEGGMASHGGFIGVTLAVWWQLKDKGWDTFFRVADVLTVPIAIGLMLGRLGNFINLELYGTVTDVPWAMAIPGVEGLRHPTQIYAMMKDAFIALICFWHLSAFRNARPGISFSIFLMMYGVLRFTVEHFRDQTNVAMFGSLSEGQILTIPLFLAGAALFFWLSKRK